MLFSSYLQNGCFLRMITIATATPRLSVFFRLQPGRWRRIQLLFLLILRCNPLHLVLTDDSSLMFVVLSILITDTCVDTRRTLTSVPSWRTNKIWTDRAHKFLSSLISDCKHCNASSTFLPNRRASLSSFSHALNSIVCFDQVFLDTVTVAHCINVAALFLLILLLSLTAWKQLTTTLNISSSPSSGFFKLFNVVGLFRIKFLIHFWKETASLLDRFNPDVTVRTMLILKIAAGDPFFYTWKVMIQISLFLILIFD